MNKKCEDWARAMIAPLISNQRKEPIICSLNKKKCPGFETGANSQRVGCRGLGG